MGLCGAQGSGKSTAAARAAQLVELRGVRCAVVSLDDAYLTRAERLALAARVHPLLATRGPPGTHDLPRLNQVLDRLQAGEAARMPAFDKLADDRAPPARDRLLPPADVVVLEGWCVGAEPQTDAALDQPVNGLERDEDPAGEWRRWVNLQLRHGYRSLFARMAGLIVLQAPSFDIVAQWRRGQEERNAALAGAAPMDDARLGRFIQHYERLTRHMLARPPAAADLTLHLDEDRRVRRVERRSW